MWNPEFEGWYFKHQKGRDTVAFIPGQAKSGAFVQVIWPEAVSYTHLTLPTKA